MWADALDRMMSILARDATVDIGGIRAISGAAQQHGSVYLNRRARDAWRGLARDVPLAPQLAGTWSRELSPVWLDESAGEQCAAIEKALGGPAATARLTGSRAFARFTGPQIRKFAECSPGAYAATTRIHLVSSFLASLLAGGRCADRPRRRVRHEPDGHPDVPLVGAGARRHAPRGWFSSFPTSAPPGPLPDRSPGTGRTDTDCRPAPSSPGLATTRAA